MYKTEESSKVSQTGLNTLILSCFLSCFLAQKCWLYSRTTPQLQLPPLALSHPSNQDSELENARTHRKDASLCNALDWLYWDQTYQHRESEDQDKMQSFDMMCVKWFPWHNKPWNMTRHRADHFFFVGSGDRCALCTQRYGSRRKIHNIVTTDKTSIGFDTSFGLHTI